MNIPALALAVLAAWPAAAASPEGLWRTIDDKTGKARAIIRIWQAGGAFHGRIESSFDPATANRVCPACTDERKDGKIIGMTIVRNMMPSDDGYGGGDILDPDTGKIYRCSFRLEEGGAHLAVRGYIGISLLGRTQTWVREK